MKYMITVMITILFFTGHGLAERTSLKEVGSGTVRYMGFIKVYTATLYTEPEVDRSTLMSENSTKCLTLHYKVSVKAEDIITAAETILKRQHDDATLQKVQPAIDELHNSYRDVGDGDIYSLCYENAAQQSSLELNGEQLVVINSPLFAQIYFGIWLGERAPISTKLRNMLIKQL